MEGVREKGRLAGMEVGTVTAWRHVQTFQGAGRTGPPWRSTEVRINMATFSCPFFVLVNLPFRQVRHATMETCSLLLWHVYA